MDPDKVFVAFNFLFSGSACILESQFLFCSGTCDFSESFSIGFQDILFILEMLGVGAWGSAFIRGSQFVDTRFGGTFC